MGLEKGQSGGQQAALAGAGAQLICIQSGEVEEPPRAPFVGEGRRQRGQGKRFGVICGGAQHGLSAKTVTLGGDRLAKILVVEDNALNIKLFCDLLAAHGHVTEPVTDSRDALEAARAFKPDLVITDIQLPYITGIELMEMLRADDELKNVPIMAVTAYAAVGDDERIRAAGASAYVSKPISVMRFAETVDQLLAEGSAVEGSSHSSQ
jgi:two-component system, cell cycle response regulator DivK